MNDPKDSIEITPEMKAAHLKIHDAIGAPELTPADLAKGAFGALAGRNESFRMEGEIRRLRSQIERLAIVAQRVAATLPHGSDRYELTVEVDNTRELLMEKFLGTEHLQ